MDRDQNFQKISWFFDLHQRGLLDLDPPYQRRSVWTQEYRDYFIDTILLNYPAPAIFLFEETSADGRANYHVVDGKQRLTSVFDFIGGKFPVGEKAQKESLRGFSFSELPEGVRKAFFSYKFSVEYIPTSDEGLISGIFDRINRNVARLSPQELRHAKYDGLFVRAAEDLTDYVSKVLPQDFPRIALSSKRHMKDVEFVAELLLYLETGPKNYSQSELDEAFAQRDVTWPAKTKVESRFLATIESINSIASAKGFEIHKTRLRNQADFYALFAVVDHCATQKLLPSAQVAAQRLSSFVEIVDDDTMRERSVEAQTYHDAARSNSNDIGQRRKRIDTLIAVLTTPGVAGASLPARPQKSRASGALKKKRSVSVSAATNKGTGKGRIKIQSERPTPRRGRGGLVWSPPASRSASG